MLGWMVAQETGDKKQRHLWWILNMFTSNRMHNSSLFVIASDVVAFIFVLIFQVITLESTKFLQ
jgi:hypothetical protein